MNTAARVTSREGRGTIGRGWPVLILLGLLVSSSCKSGAPGRLERPTRPGESPAPRIEEASGPSSAAETLRSVSVTSSAPKSLRLQSAPDYLSFPRRDDRLVASVAGESLHKSQIFDYLMTAYPEKVRGAVAVMLGNRVLGSEAARFGIRVSESEVATWYRKHREAMERRARLEFGDGTSFESWLARTTTQTEPEYRSAAMNRERSKRLLGRVIRYLQLREDRVEFRLVSLTERRLAQAVERSLKEGADFSTIARQYSVHPTAERGGKMLPVWRGALQADLEDAVFALSPGEVTPIVTARDQEGRERFQLAKLLKYHRGAERPYAEVEGQILESLRQVPISPDEWSLWQIRVERLADLRF